MTVKLSKNAKFIIEKLTSFGFECYAVGGCVRDSIMGITPHDWDFATSATPEQIKKCFSDYKLYTIGEKFFTIGVCVDDEIFEITTYRTESDYNDNRHPKGVEIAKSLESDLSRRDFTINAIAYNDEKGIVDPFFGVNDIKLRTIRCVGDPDKRFSEDALRILRALRFSSRFSFSIDMRTHLAINKNKNLLSNIASERIITEFEKLLCADNVEYILKTFREVFAVFIPEITAMFDYDQHTIHHNRDLWSHTVTAVKSLDKDPILRTAMFFHDIAKPMTARVDKNTGSYHYYNHNQLGAVMTNTILKRLKYSNEFIKHVSTLIEYHDNRLNGDTYKIKKMLDTIGEEWIFDLFKIQRADIIAQSDYEREEKFSNLEKSISECKRILSQHECYSLKELKINGKDIIHLGVSKGESIKATLDYLLDKVQKDEIENNSEILVEKAKRYIKSSNLS